MATQNLVEEEGIFYFLRQQYGSVENAAAANPEIWAGAGAWPGAADEASLREALEGPQHDQIIAVLIGLAKAPPPAGYERLGPDIRGNGLRERTETVDKDETLTIHAEKNQDIEVENDETHFVPRTAHAGVWDDTDIVHVLEDDGPTHLLGLPGGGGNSARAWDGDYGFDGVGITSDWNGDGSDTVGLRAHRPGGALWDGPHEQLVVGQPDSITGDWNSDGPDMVTAADFNGDGIVDAADYVV